MHGRPEREGNWSLEYFTKIMYLSSSARIVETRMKCVWATGLGPKDYDGDDDLS